MGRVQKNIATAIENDLTAWEGAQRIIVTAIENCFHRVGASPKDFRDRYTFEQVIAPLIPYFCEDR